MTDFVVRLARLDDAEGFVQAYEASWDGTLAPIVGKSLAELVPYEQRLAAYRAGFDSPPADGGIWVAERESEIVGTAVRRGSELSALYVVPDAWGTGVAQALVAAALEAMHADGHAEASLWVGSDNARGRRFYEREGWLATEETRPSQLGPSEVRYRLSLAQS
jgi:GNAT superfamily N-acetyltransferase